MSGYCDPSLREKASAGKNSLEGESTSSQSQSNLTFLQTDSDLVYHCAGDAEDAKNSKDGASFLLRQVSHLLSNKVTESNKGN